LLRARPAKVLRCRVRTVVGVDLQSIDDVEASMRTFGTRYTHRLYTDHELECSGNDPASAAVALAARFAAKEAVLKILSTESDVPPWKTIEVRRSKNRPPAIELHGAAADLARRQGVRNLSLSLSHAGGVATATVVAEVPQHHPRIAR
jgi:holo-[acyl-carrier protein] synthase